MSPHALVVCCGNPLRGDDGVGAAVAESLPSMDGARVVVCRQLAPELAPDVGAASLVVFVDAAVDAEPGRVLVTPVQAAADTSPLSHHCSPAGLLWLAGHLHGHHPNGILVRIGAARFDAAEGLHPCVAAAVPRAISAVIEAVAVGGVRLPASPSGR